MLNDNTSGLSPYVPQVHFELIPIENLVSNQKYQRELSWKQIGKIVRNFDLNLVNAIRVSRRDGVNYVVDGQHTIEAIAQISRSRSTPVWCMVSEELSYTREAELFAEQQQCVKQLVPYDVFNAKLEAKCDDQLRIRDLVGSYNLRVTCCSSAGGICAVGALEDIYYKYGITHLKDTLDLCIGTWQGESRSLSRNVLCAVAKIIYAYGEQIDKDLFRERLAQYSMAAIQRGARDRRPGAAGFAEEIVSLYNKSRTGHSSLLDIEVLRTVKLPKRRDKVNAAASAARSIPPSEPYRSGYQTQNLFAQD